MLDNLEHAFPGKYTPEQLRRLVRDVFEHFGLMLLEMLIIPAQAASPQLAALITLADAEGDRRVFGSGRPAWS